MTGWSTIRKIREFEERAARLGFAIQEPRQQNPAYSATSSITSTYKGFWIDEMSVDNVSLTPVDNRYPFYRRGASVFSGTLEEGRFFLQGIEFAYTSDQAIGMSNEKKRKVYEGRYRERQLRLEEAKKKRAEQKKVWDILQHGRQMEEQDEEVPF
jgi:hypothetical protein